MQVKNLVDYSLSSVKSIAHQTVNCGGRTLSFMQANPLVVAIATLALTVLGALILGYKQISALKNELDSTNNETTKALTSLKKQAELVAENVEDQQSDYDERVEDMSDGSALSSGDDESIGNQDSKHIIKKMNRIDKDVDGVFEDLNTLFQNIEQIKADQSSEELKSQIFGELHILQEQIKRSAAAQADIHAKILKLFEAIIDKIDQIGESKSKNDPTAQVLADLLSTSQSTNEMARDFEKAQSELNGRTPVKPKQAHAQHLPTPFKAPHQGSRIQGKKD